MEGLHIDVTMLVTIWVVGAIIMIPLLAMAARYGVAPCLEALGRARSAEATRVEADLRRRVAVLERRLHEMDETKSGGYTAHPDTASGTLIRR